MDYTTQVFNAVFAFCAPDALPSDHAALRDLYVAYILDTTSEGLARELALSVPVDFSAIAARVAA